MTSAIRYYGFKDISLTRRRSSLIVIPLMLLGYLVVVFSEWVLLLMAASYMISGVTLHAIRHFRRPKLTAPAP